MTKQQTKVPREFYLEHILDVLINQPLWDALPKGETKRIQKLFEANLAANPYVEPAPVPVDWVAEENRIVNRIKQIGEIQRDKQQTKERVHSDKRLKAILKSISKLEGQSFSLEYSELSKLAWRWQSSLDKSAEIEQTAYDFMYSQEQSMLLIKDRNSKRKPSLRFIKSADSIKRTPDCRTKTLTIDVNFYSHHMYEYAKRNMESCGYKLDIREAIEGIMHQAAHEADVFAEANIPYKKRDFLTQQDVNNLLEQVTGVSDD